MIFISRTSVGFLVSYPKKNWFEIKTTRNESCVTVLVEGVAAEIDMTTHHSS